MAKDFAEKVVSSKGLQVDFSNLKLVEYPVSTELEIVNPNYLLTPKFSGDITTRTRKARLAWVIKYNLIEIEHKPIKRIEFRTQSSSGLG